MALGRGVPGVPGLGRGAEAGVRRPSRGRPQVSATLSAPPPAPVPEPGSLGLASGGGGSAVTSKSRYGQQTEPSSCRS